MDMKPTLIPRLPAAPVWSRRTFLAATLGAAAAHACTRSPESKQIQQWRELDQRLLEVLGELRLPDRIGQAYLTRTRLEGASPGLEELLARLRLRLVAPAQISGGHPDKGELLQILAAAVRDDFVAGRICEVQNWYLSLTECQAAAIGFLSRGGAVAESSLDGYTAATICEITDWGPHSTLEGETFNIQPDGSSAFWFRAAGAPSDTRVLLGDVSLKTTVSEATVTADLKPGQASRVLNQVGTYAVYLVSDGALEAQHVGEFEVRSKPSDEPTRLEAFSTEAITGIESWGPHQTTLGVGFNVQPGGESAFWVKVAPPLAPGTSLYLGTVPLKTTVQTDVVTATVNGEAQALLDRPGRVELYLVDPVNRRKQMVGEFQIVP